MTTKTFGIQVRDHNGVIAGFVCKDIVHARSTPFATDPDTAFAMARRVNETEAKRAARGDNPRTIISWKAAPLWSAPVVTETTPQEPAPTPVRTKAALFETFVDGEYHARPARYAKGMMKIATPSRDGFKTRAARLAEAIARGRWTNRESAYVLSPSAAARFVKLYAEGYDASPITGELRAPSHA